MVYQTWRISDWSYNHHGFPFDHKGKTTLTQWRHQSKSISCLLDPSYIPTSKPQWLRFLCFLFQNYEMFWKLPHFRQCCQVEPLLKFSRKLHGQIWHRIQSVKFLTVTICWFSKTTTPSTKNCILFSCLVPYIYLLFFPFFTHVSPKILLVMYPSK